MTDIHVWFGAVVRTTGTAGMLPLICSVVEKGLILGFTAFFQVYVGSSG